MYDTAAVEDVEELAPGMTFLRDALDCEHLGVTLLEADPGWAGKPHDHADDGQEEVYLLVEGTATVTIEGEEVGMSAGDAVRIDPDATREIAVGAEPATFVLAGAP
ncbi:cupin domain-containing protein [Halococcoides cellulosivorans]|uniref:Cupin n=1 Tax=Halococcoides cellulosivorans TaxID=1679096 RepID=A0A2R4WZH2_9EURY|nr:cupin domain-containing protein [Halococcoides cellulosivorans]AWB26946.1 cupin [Halococcoides cellulosivorans]